MVRPERLELPTLGSEDRCSIQLSYGRADLMICKEDKPTSATHSRCDDLVSGDDFAPSLRNAVRLPSGIDVHLHRNTQKWANGSFKELFATNPPSANLFAPEHSPNSHLIKRMSIKPSEDINEQSGGNTRQLCQSYYSKPTRRPVNKAPANGLQVDATGQDTVHPRGGTGGVRPQYDS